MDILGFLMVLAAIGIAPRFGVDQAIRAILSDALAAGSETYSAIRQQYVHMATKPVIIVTCIAMALQTLALVLAWWLMPSVALMPLTIVSLVLMATEGVCAYRSRLAIPHWLRNARGVDVQFPEHLHTLAANNAIYALPDEDEFAGLFVDRDGDFVNINGEYVDMEGNVVDADHALKHEQAGAPVLDPAHDHRPGRFSLGWSLARVMGTFLVMGAWIAYLGIQASNTPVFMIGVTCIYSMLAVLALLADFIAWFLVKGTKLMEFIATIVSEEVLVTLPGIKWSNIKSYLPEGVNILDEDRLAAKVRAFPIMIALYLAIPVMLIYAWTDQEFATYVLMFTFLATGTGVVLAAGGGANLVANQNYKFLVLMRYVLPTFVIFAAIYALLPGDVADMVKGQGLNLKSAIVGYGSGAEHIRVKGAWSNFGSLILWLIVAGILAMAAKAVSPKDGNGSAIRRWAGAMLGALVVLAIVASAWRGYGLVKNASGETTVSVPKVDVRTSEKKEIDEPKQELSKDTKRLEERNAQPASAPAAPPAQTDAPRDTKPPVRYAGKVNIQTAPLARPARPRSGTGRGELSPEFLALERQLESGNYLP